MDNARCETCGRVSVASMCENCRYRFARATPAAPPSDPAGSTAFLLQQNQELREQRAALTENCERLERERDEARERAVEMQASVQEVERELHEAQTSLNTEALRYREAELNQLRAERDGARKALEDRDAMHAEQVREIEAERLRLAAEVEGLKAQLREDARQLEKGVALALKYQAEVEHLKQVQRELTGMDESIATKDQEMLGMHRVIESLRAEVERLRAELEHQKERHDLICNPEMRSFWDCKKQDEAEIARLREALEGIRASRCTAGRQNAWCAHCVAEQALAAQAPGDLCERIVSSEKAAGDKGKEPEVMRANKAPAGTGISEAQDTGSAPEDSKLINTEISSDKPTPEQVEALTRVAEAAAGMTEPSAGVWEALAALRATGWRSG